MRKKDNNTHYYYTTKANRALFLLKYQQLNNGYVVYRQKKRIGKSIMIENSSIRWVDRFELD